MRTIPVLIVDDDANSMKLSRQAMEQLIEPSCVHCASSASETIQVLQDTPIELAFLDIDMPDTNGFSIAEYIHRNYPSIAYVFLTGYVDFAARSFDYEPLDFLTKPIDLMRLQKTLDRFEHRSRQNTEAHQERIALDTSEGLVLLTPGEISHIVKEHRTVKILCLDGREYGVRRSMDELEAIFSDFGFFRTHQSYLVPLSNVVSVRPARFGKTYEALMENGACLPVSRDRYQRIRTYLSSRGVHFI